MRKWSGCGPRGSGDRRQLQGVCRSGTVAQSSLSSPSQAARRAHFLGRLVAHDYGTRGVWFGVRRTMGPLARLANAASDIANSHDHTGRVGSTGRRDEIGRLAVTVDRMLEALEETSRSNKPGTNSAPFSRRLPRAPSPPHHRALVLGSAGEGRPRRPELRPSSRGSARRDRPHGENDHAASHDGAHRKERRGRQPSGTGRRPRRRTVPPAWPGRRASRAPMSSWGSGELARECARLKSHRAGLTHLTRRGIVRRISG
ncbi:MAG: HAMP domain-containing protein [Actinobacteria bacterium]|nr:HAMP domain-containing protein [Actinomycetota bacterium]